MDNAFTNNNNSLLKCGHLINDITDHLSIHVIINNNVRQQEINKYTHCRENNLLFSSLNKKIN